MSDLLAEKYVGKSAVLATWLEGERASLDPAYVMDLTKRVAALRRRLEHSKPEKKQIPLDAIPPFLPK